MAGEIEVGRAAVRIIADDSAFWRDIRRLSTATVNDIKVKADADTAPAEASLSRFAANDRSVDINADLDTGRAVAKLAALGATGVESFNTIVKTASNVFRAAIPAAIALSVAALQPLMGGAGIGGSAIAAVGAGYGLIGLAAAETFAKIKYENGKFIAEEGMTLSKTQKQLIDHLNEAGKAYSKAFDPANEAFNRFALKVIDVADDTFPRLGVAAEETTNAVSRAFDEVVKALSKPEQLASYERFLKAVPGITADFTSAAGKFFGGIFNILSEAIPYAKDFARYVDDLASRFLAFTQSDAGRRKIREFFESAKDLAPKVAEAVRNIAGGLLEISKDPDTQRFLKDFVEFVGTIARNLGRVNDFVDALGRIFKFLRSKNGGKDGKSLGKDIRDGILDGLFGTLRIDFVEGFIRAWRQVRQWWGANSPSRKAAELGRDIMQGMVQGLKRINILQAILGVFRGVVNAVRGVWNQVRNATSQAWRAIKNAVVAGARGAANGLRAAWNGLRGIALSAWNAIRSAVVNAWRGIRGAVSSGANTVQRLLASAWSRLRSLASSAWNAVRQAVAGAWNNIKNTVASGAKAVSSVMQGAWNKLRSLTSGAWNTIKNAIASAWDNIRKTVTGAVNAVRSAIARGWEQVKRTSASVWNSIKGSIISTWNAIKSAVSRAVNVMQASLASGWNKAKSAAIAAWNAIKSSIINAWTQIKNSVNSAINSLQSNLTSGWSKAKSAAIAAWNAIKSSVTNALSSIISSVRGFVSNMSSAITNHGWWGIGASVVAGIRNGITSNWNIGELLWNMAASAWKRVTDFFRNRSPSKRAEETGRHIVEGLRFGITKNSHLFGDAAEKMAKDGWARARRVQLGAVSSLASIPAPSISAINASHPSMSGGLNMPISVHIAGVSQAEAEQIAATRAIEAVRQGYAELRAQAGTHTPSRGGIV